MPAPTSIGSPRYNAAKAEATKVTTNKATAAALVTSIATDVSNGDFNAAAKKSHQLGDIYGALASNRQP